MTSLQICSLVVLAQLSPVHGFQIKWALEFPDAPLGAIEFILAHVIKKLGDAGVRTATFGAGATGTLQRVDNVGGFKVRTLEKTYNGISHTFHLSGKGDFRGKFGVEQDPLYICYPKGGLGTCLLLLYLVVDVVVVVVDVMLIVYCCFCRYERYRSYPWYASEAQVDVYKRRPFFRYDYHLHDQHELRPSASSTGRHYLGSS